METTLPSPMTAKVYDNLLEGNPIHYCLGRNRLKSWQKKQNEHGEILKDWIFLSFFPATLAQKMWLLKRSWLCSVWIHIGKAWKKATSWVTWNSYMEVKYCMAHVSRLNKNHRMSGLPGWEGFPEPVKQLGWSKFHPWNGDFFRDGVTIGFTTFTDFYNQRFRLEE